MAVVMLSKTVLYLTKTFAVETLYYCKLREMLNFTTDILQSVVLVHLCLLAEQQGEVAPSLPHAGAAAGSGGTTVGPAYTGQGVSG